MRLALLCLSFALAGCNQSGLSPDGEPIDQLAGFAGVPTMQPGADCMSCHAAGGSASDRIWTVAGTVFSDPQACDAFIPSNNSGCAAGQQGAQVLLTDVNGQELTLTANSAGNFYTDQPIGTLASVMIQNGSHRMVMNLPDIGGGSQMTLSALGIDQPAAGNAVSCNACHSVQNTAVPYGGFGAPGSLFVPQE